ncbi:MAG: NAD(P)/FAD-dependent oxidoreductase [Pseudomonadales bacterium]
MSRAAQASAGFESSWYYATAKGLSERPPLTERLRADVCVIGGGYTGLSAALELAERGYSVVLLEGYRIGAGASGRNGGVMGMGQRKDQDELERWLGIDDARALWQVAVEANALVRERIERFAIDCDLKDGELHAAHRRRYASDYWNYVDLLAERYDYHDCRKVEAAEMAEMLGMQTYHGGYLDQRAGHLHPLNLALGLARACAEQGVQLFEHSQVLDYHPPSGGSDLQIANPSHRTTVRTARGEVDAEYLVLACNGYLGRLAPAIESYQMPINNFVLATAPLGEDRARQLNRDDVAVVDSRFVVNYFRMSPDHRLLFGGGENYSPRFPRDLKSFVRGFMLEVYPQLADVPIDYAWGGTLAITLRRMPHFGRAGNVFWAHGYSGHGIAMANMGGKLIAEAMAGTAERFDLFARLPHRRFPGGRYLRWPALVAGMLYYALLDRL